MRHSQRRLSFRSSKSRKRITVNQSFIAQVNAIARQLADAQRDKVWVLNPNKSSFLGSWDGITSLALIYTALVTPFEVAFISASTKVDAWFVINRVLDLIFIIDVRAGS